MDRSISRTVGSLRDGRRSRSGLREEVAFCNGEDVVSSPGRQLFPGEAKSMPKTRAVSIVGCRVKAVGDEESKIDCEVTVVFGAELVAGDVAEEVVKACSEVAIAADRLECEEFW